VAEELIGGEEEWVAEAGDAEDLYNGAGVAEVGAAEALHTGVGVAEAGATEAGGVTDALSVEAGAGVLAGPSSALASGVVAQSALCGPIVGAVFPGKHCSLTNSDTCPLPAEGGCSFS